MTYDNVVTNLTILDRNGTVKAVVTGKAAFAGSNGINVTQDTDGALLIAADGTVGADDPAYKNKYAKLISGGSGSADGVDFNFSGQNNQPYYIATINSAKGYEDGYSFMLGSQCPQMGLFPDITGTEVEPSAIENGMEFFDLCQACVDCYDYDRLCMYIDRIKLFIDNNKNKNLIVDSGHTGSPTRSTGLWKQYLALLHLWNYLVHAQNFIFKASVDETKVNLTVGYRCPFCGPFANVEVDIEVVSLTGDNYVKVASGGASYLQNPINLRTTYACEYLDAVNPYVENGYKCTLLIDPSHLDPAAVSKGYYVVRNMIWNPSVEVPATCVAPAYPPPCPYRPKVGITNTWTIRVTWKNTHAGFDVTRTRIVKTKGVTMP